MLSRWRWRLLQIARTLWLRSLLYVVAGAGAALVSLFLQPMVPDGLAGTIGSEAVYDLLNIIAASMLTVTTFSLGAMVAAYAAATSSVTPRATRLLMQDRTSQNVLSTFIGAFLFSLVGIIALSTGAYGERGRVVLFIITIGLIVVIVATLLRWIEHLARLGRVGETSERVEKAALDAMRQRIETPNLGCDPYDPDTLDTSKLGFVSAGSTGYVQHIDIEALQKHCEDPEGRIYVAAPPGAFVHAGEPLAWLESGTPPDKKLDEIAGAFLIDPERSFDQDPRFGLCVLSEIASRALSPAVNDPGTAIDIIGRATRVLLVAAKARAVRKEAACPAVRVPALAPDDLFDDAFLPIARDGAGMIEVQLRLQKALEALARTEDKPFREAALSLSRQALDYGLGALTSEAERKRLTHAAQCVGSGDRH
jgi:uncharacterized membrane protein